MNKCQNCGQMNNNGSNFCRFCGVRMFDAQASPNYSEPQQAPRPYMWKTDEYPTAQPSTRKTEEIRQVQPLSEAQTATFQPNQLSNMAPMHSAPVAPYGFRCPRCGSQQMPYMRRQVSAPGWIVFTVLLLTTVVFFWIGLLIKEDVKICPSCNYKFN